MAVLAMVSVAMVTMGAAPAPYSPADEGQTELDKAGCKSRCSDCKNRCSKKSGQEKTNCEEDCYDANAKCCEANNGKQLYNICGCN